MMTYSMITLLFLLVLYTCSSYKRSNFPIRSIYQKNSKVHDDNIHNVIKYSCNKQDINISIASFDKNKEYVLNYIPNILLGVGIAIIVTLFNPVLSYAVSDDLTTVMIVKPVIDTLVNILSLLFLCRIVISWYPKTDLRQFPYNVIIWPTEALAQPMRALIPPAFGVDIAPLVWIAILNFVREIFTGQQGILTLLERNAADML